MLGSSHRSLAARAVVVGALIITSAHLVRQSVKAPAVRRWLQKSLWKVVYGFASRGAAAPAFMNYGYSVLDADGGDGPPLQADADRFGVQLYDRVARGPQLTGKDVLEIGCGRGGGTAFLFDTYRPRTMTGLDLAHSAIARCRREHARPGLEFVQGDAEALPFADASFDVVVNVESSHCYPDVPRFLGEVDRVLRPGGLLCLADVRHADLGSRTDDTLIPHADIGQLLDELHGSPFITLEQEDITANVVRALRLDSPRRRQAIANRVPKALQQHALVFAAVEGSPLYDSLAGGEGTYLRFVLQKPS